MPEDITIKYLAALQFQQRLLREKATMTLSESEVAKLDDIDRMLPSFIAPPPPLVERAEQIARRAHWGQFRHDCTTPYIEHVERVVARLSAETEVVRSTAWLHDVLEDTDVTAEQLVAAHIPSEVVEAVKVLTKNQGPYINYVTAVANNAIARVVKIADILDNLTDQPNPDRIVKYARALLILHGYKWSRPADSGDHTAHVEELAMAARQALEIANLAYNEGRIHGRKTDRDETGVTDHEYCRRYQVIEARLQQALQAFEPKEKPT